MSEIKDTQQHPKVEIAVKNFGPIAEANIDLRPLTVFVGPSNTGKTYFATLVYALHGIFAGFSRSGILFPLGLEWFTGSSGSGEFFTDSALSMDDVEALMKKLKVGIPPFKVSDLPERMLTRAKTIIENSEVFSNILQADLKNCFDLSSVHGLIRLTEEQSNEMRISLKVSSDAQEYWSIGMNVSESQITLNRFANEDMIPIPEKWGFAPNSFGYTQHWSEENRYYLPAARSGIMQSYRVIASSIVKRTTRGGLERSPEVPTMSEVMADFMERIILYEENKVLNDKMKHLAVTLESDILAGQIHVKLSPGGSSDFYYSPQGIEGEMRLNQASSMVSELAPLVLYLRGLVRPGDTLIIEEPEAHLHPGAQADMAVILARLVRAGIKVIITTHSDWLLQEIGNLIRAGELEKAGKEVSDLPTSLQEEQVGIWHFQKDGKVGEIPYNRIDGVEPMEYLDVAEDLYNRSARLQNRLEEMKGDSERE